MSAEHPMLDPLPDVRELCDRRGAEELKSKIEIFWACRGKRVHVWLEKKGFVSTMRGARWDVRSDLLDGLPANTDTPALSQKDAA